jgi:hypothetical protein
MHDDVRMTGMGQTLVVGCKFVCCAKYAACVSLKQFKPPACVQSRSMGASVCVQVMLEATSMEEQKSTMFSHGGGGPI